jgi:hypothetical protein
MAIATCGHEVEEGISCSIYSTDREGLPCLSFGTYCPDCVIGYYRSGLISNGEMCELISKIVLAEWTEYLA